jgi:hypothetical protein
MTRIVIDEKLRTLLGSLAEPIELCDSAGQTIGHFLPEEAFKQMALAWANASVTDEELNQRRQEPGGRTLAEIWKDLGSR